MKIGDKVSVKGTGVLGPVVRVNATEALVRTTDDRGYTATGAYIGARNQERWYALGICISVE